MEHKKVALVLAGGGVAGVAFQVGVLRALNEAWLNRTVNDLDLYVGTSAGSYVAAYLASGISLGKLQRFMSRETGLLGSGGPAATFFPNVSEVIEKLAFWPFTMLQATGAMLRSRNPVEGTLRAIEEFLPSGLFDTWLMQQRLYRNYRRFGRGNRFARLPHDLFIIATDLDNGERVVFSRENDVPLEKAVAASCAVPLLYRPVRIAGRDYVDGGVRGTASLDLAIEQGADLVVVINSMVPFRNDPDVPAQRWERGEPHGHVADRGPLAISNQVTRAAIHGGLLYHIKQIKRAHPHVNVMLIEPPINDPMLSFRNVMAYWKLDEVARHGFRVGLDFWARNEAQAREVLAQRGIEMVTRLPEPAAA
jgi:predicted acylesterase/phospholipase RssA